MKKTLEKHHVSIKHIRAPLLSALPMTTNLRFYSFIIENIRDIVQRNDIF